MKLTSIVLFLLTAFFFSACESNSKKATSEKQTQESPKKEMTEVEVSEPNPSELSQAEAKKLLDDFANIVVSSPSKAFVCGFKTSHGDIQALYNDLDTTNIDTIFAMIGYNTDLDEFDLVFCIETPTGSGDYLYYDFTSPCPAECPSYMTPVPPTLNELNGQKGYWFGREGMSHFLEVGTDPSISTYCVYMNGQWSQDLYLVECPATCTEPQNGVNPRFEPCGASSEPCHSIQ